MHFQTESPNIVGIFAAGMFCGIPVGVVLTWVVQLVKRADRKLDKHLKEPA
jgi:hypothetical protein